jgi:hypothetical protein
MGQPAEQANFHCAERDKVCGASMRLRELYSVGICYIIVTKVNRVTGDTKLSIVLDANNVTM